MNRRPNVEMDLSGAMAWATEPKDLASLGRRSVAFFLALCGPGHFGCSKLDEVAAMKGIPSRTLHLLQSELRRSFGIFPLGGVFSASPSMTPDEASDRLGVSGRSIRRAIQRGDLPALRVNSRVIRVSEIDLATYCALKGEGVQSDQT